MRIRAILELYYSDLNKEDAVFVSADVDELMSGSERRHLIIPSPHPRGEVSFKLLVVQGLGVQNLEIFP